MAEAGSESVFPKDVLVYSQFADRPLAERLSARIESLGYSSTTEYNSDKTKCRVVIWSKNPEPVAESNLLMVSLLAEHNENLINVAFEHGAIPARYDEGRVHILENWDGSSKSPEFQALLDHIDDVLKSVGWVVPLSRQVKAPPKPTFPRASVSGQIFVSHSASDGSQALKLVEAIERSGKRCWIAPRDVRAGRDFREEIVMAIQQCESMIVLISKDANDKPQHILRELSLAEKGGKTIKPVRLDDCKLTAALEYQLEALHWVRFEPSLTFVDSLIAE